MEPLSKRRRACNKQKYSSLTGEGNSSSRETANTRQCSDGPERSGDSCISDKPNIQLDTSEYTNADTDAQTPVNHRNHEAAAAPDVVDVLPPAVYTGRRSLASLGATMALSGVSVGRLELPKSWLKPG